MSDLDTYGHIILLSAYLQSKKKRSEEPLGNITFPNVPIDTLLDPHLGGHKGR